jgi:uncharacterized protein YqgV (UPF0045/DUF77 family)
MKVQAEISIYPLRVKSLSEPVETFCKALREHGLEIETTAMSSFVSCESKDFFDACREAFEQISEKYDAVLHMKVSNSCPLRTND